MSRRVPLRSEEGRRLVEQGPAWREHPDYWAPDNPDEDEPIRSHTARDAQQALERMHAWASTSDPLMRLVWDLLDDTQRGNLARVACELRPRGDA